MQLLAEKWQLVFGGVGTAVVAAIVGAWAKSYFDKKAKDTPTCSSPPHQDIRSGEKSTNIQAGRDANIGDRR